MSSGSAHVLTRSFQTCSQAFSTLVILVSGIVLAGGIFHLPMLVAMSADTALALLLLGLACRGEKAADPKNEKSNTAESLCYAGAACLIALISIILTNSYLHNLVVQTLTSSAWAAHIQAHAPSLMPLDTAAELLITGLAIVFLQTRSTALNVTGQILATISVLYAALGMVATLFGVSYAPLNSGAVTNLSQLLVLSSPVAASCALISLSGLFAHPERTFKGILITDRRGGGIFRTLLSASVLVALALGWLTVQGQWRALYDFNLGVAILTVCLTALFGALLLVIAWKLDLMHKSVVSSGQTLQGTEEQNRLTLDNLYEALIGVDADGKITRWNKQAAVTFGWTTEEVMNRSFAEVVLPDDVRPVYEKAIANFGKPSQSSEYAILFGCHLEVSLIHRDGHEFPAELSITPVELGELVQFCVLARDLSESKRLSRELGLARDQAMEASRLKSEFVANISHEIRTPLNAIVGLSDLLLRRHLNDDVRDFAATIRDSADTLLSIVNDILDYSKIEAG
ncbi:MAG TPA: histidine kinase dimerization/phospho-acceptor domain-containing protein, partial [Chroococcales cyanobacterium]